MDVPFPADLAQTLVLEHRRGPLLVTGAAGAGMSSVLRERVARLIEDGADPERVVLVVRSSRARAEARRSLLGRLRRSLPGLKILTVHGLAFHVVGRRYQALGYVRPPEVLPASGQFAKVQELLEGEDPAAWPAYGAMLGMRGFADEVRQFLLRAQEALVPPEEVASKARSAGVTGWLELAAFYRRYLQVLDDEEAVDFAGLIVQAAASAAGGEPLFDHVVVDDYQEGTFALERMLADLRPESLVVGGDPDAHVFSFQGTTDIPIRRFTAQFPSAGHVELATPHRAPRLSVAAWFTPHTSEEHASAARELRRVHVQDGVPWGELAVVVRRQGAHVGGLLRALDDAGIPRSAPEAGVSLLAEPATYPFVLALRWLAAGPEHRDSMVEALMVSDLAGLSPAAGRGLVRAAVSDGGSPAAALHRRDGLAPAERTALDALAEALDAAEPMASRSALDAFRALWLRLPAARRLVEEGRPRDLDAVLALVDALTRSVEQPDGSVAGFLAGIEAGQEGPGVGPDRDPGRPDAVTVLTAHGAAGREFDTVIVVGAVEGDFPSVSRPEPMFDIQALERRISQSERNRLRLEDERRLFRLVIGRARRRVVVTASGPHGEETTGSMRSRFVGTDLAATWVQGPGGPFDVPLTVAEALAGWRRTLADTDRAAPERLAAVDGLAALGADPMRWWYQREWTGTDRPLHERVRVSYSKLDRLDNCALQFVLSEELGLESRTGYHAWVGQLVHRLIEECELGLIPRDLDALVVAAEERWQPAQFPSRAVSEAFRRLVVSRMLPGWFREYGGSPALDREVHFEFPFDDATVSGYIDRISAVQRGGSQITDYKTGKARNATKAEENLQLGIYYLAVHSAEELAAYRPVRGVELAFLRDRDRDGYIARAAKGFTPKDRDDYAHAMTERLTGLVDRIHEGIRTEVYRPDPTATCRYCDFKTLCPLWPEGGEAVVVAGGEPVGAVP